VIVTKDRLYKLLHEKRALQRYLARRVLFPLGELIGLHIVADHFYEPIPNLRLVRRNYSESPVALPQIRMNLQAAADRHVTRLKTFAHEFFSESTKLGYVEKNHYFRGADAISLYCFVRSEGIRRIVEIGQGYSTLVSAAALSRNGQESSVDSELISVDPYERLPFALERTDRLSFSSIPARVQDIRPGQLTGHLGEKTLLFIDSSHVLKCGSDVEYLMYKIYPNVPTASHIHIHDVFTPYPWPLRNYEQKWFWNEQDYLQNFLSFNECFEVTLPLYGVLQEDKRVQEIVGAYRREFGLGQTGSSFYIQRVK
jgi:hypothetical protein